MQYHPIPRDDLFYNAISFKEYNVISCKSMQYNTYVKIQCHTVPFHSIPCNTMPYHGTQYNTTLVNTIKGHAIPHYVMQYHIIQYNTI